MILVPTALDPRFLRGVWTCLAGYQTLRNSLSAEGVITQQSSFVRSARRLEGVLQQVSFPVSNVSWMNRRIEWYLERHGHIRREEAEQWLNGLFGPLVPDGGRMRVVAEGGSGMVFSGTLWGPERLRAVKLGFKDYKPLLETEFRLQSRMDSPRIVRVEDYGVTPDGEPYLVMEYLPGPDLRQYLLEEMEDAGEERRGFDLEKTVRFACEAAEALAICHEHDIIHRDFKPANLFVTEDDGIKLGDFGLAVEWRGQNTRAPNPRDGTEGYIAPELMSGAVPSPRTDVFSLGRVLYELFTGNLLEGANLRPGDNLPRPKHHRTGARIPNSLIEVVSRAIRRNPGQRYPSARPVYEDLKRIHSSIGDLIV